jgi:hypothetical protein
MINIIELSVLSFLTETPKKEQLAKEFVVKVNDRGPLYIPALVKLINKYNKVAAKIKYGDYLVFKTKEVYRETSSNDVIDLDLPIYKLSDDFKKIEKLINNFFENVYKPATTCDICDYCPFSTKCRRDTIIRDGEWVSSRKEEKVTIFNNYVKVGYDQYDIHTNFYGEETVKIRGQKFEVLSDYKGYYLQLI